MKRVVKEILIGAVAAVCFLPASCSKSESSIEQVLERANAEYKMRNLPEAMDAAREAKKLDAAAAAVPEKFAPYARELMVQLMALSRAYQNETRGLPKKENDHA